jgi:hypothetical protein
MPTPVPVPAPVAPSPAAKDILHISFNQDYGCFAPSTKSGFRIYNCDPFREIFRRDLAVEGGVDAGAGEGVSASSRCCSAATYSRSSAAEITPITLPTKS